MGERAHTKGLIRIINADCREALRSVPDQSVHCCVTSPLYFGLRDYGHAGQIGLEDNPSAFVTEMVSVLREVRRVLRDDGTLWLNLGDSYANDTKWGGSTSGKHARGNHGDTWIGRRRTNTGLKSNDLIGIPWRVAFALQEDGWYRRQDISWSKPNPMPESVQDRCTKAHEYLFLLSKSQRYHYDADAIAEGLSETSIARLSQGGLATQKGSDRVPGKTNGPMKAVGRVRGVPPRHAVYASSDQSGLDDVERGRRRNKRSVWTVATQPFKDAHFATFPPDLIEPCIKAGCPTGGVVLDPFGGAGTTGLVADRLGRSAVLIELKPEYAAMGRPLIEATNDKFPSASAMDVWDKEKAIVFPHGAPCTRHLKKGARLQYESRNRVDWHVFGFTAEEKTRHDDFVLTERSNVLPVLIEAGPTKQDCYNRLTAAGVAPPRVYAEG